VSETTTFTVTSNKNIYSIDDRGSGRCIVLYPSLGRPGSDFEELSISLSESGFRTVSITPPGFSTPLVDPGWGTLFDVAGELWGIIDQIGINKPIVIGHAFGNRVARAFSTIRPDSVAALILLACGGDVAPSSEVHEVFLRIFDPSRSDAERERDVKEVFFAPVNEVGEWRYGWNGQLALFQAAAVRSTNHSEFYSGGIAPGLVIQGLNDLIAPPENSRNFVSKRPNTKLINLENCGHAMLTEQPALIREELISFLSSQKFP